MRRTRLLVWGLGSVAVAVIATWGCIPHPEDDFADYQARVAQLPKPEIEASTFEAAPPPTTAVEGLYYGACLSELGFGQPSKVFNFYTLTKYTPEGDGAKLTLSIQPLAVVAGAPPPKVEKANAVGTQIESPALSAPNVDAKGKFLTQLGTVSVPGSANPISGSDVLIEVANLEGRFAESKFCARLGGKVVKPEAAARTLDPPQNICQFVPIKDGDPTPKFTAADFQTASCPLE